MFMGAKLLGGKGIEVRRWVHGVDGGEEIVRPRMETFIGRERSEIMVLRTSATMR